MKQGALIFDEQTDRYDIRFDLADYYGGLHCGECFDVMIGGKWPIAGILSVSGPTTFPACGYGFDPHLSAASGGSTLDAASDFQTRRDTYLEPSIDGDRIKYSPTSANVREKP